MGRIAECAVLDKDISRRAIPRELRVVIRPSALAALHNNAVVINGDIDITNREAAALVDVDCISRRALKLFPLRVFQDVGQYRAVVNYDILAVVEVRRPELGVLERHARDVNILRPRDIEDTRTHKILVAQVAALLPCCRALCPKLLPCIRAVPVYHTLARNLEAVASIGIDERGIILARLALDARLAHRIALGIVHANDRRAFFEMQIDAWFKEDRTRVILASRQDKRAAALRCNLINPRLQRPHTVLRRKSRTCAHAAQRDKGQNGRDMFHHAPILPNQRQSDPTPSCRVRTTNPLRQLHSPKHYSVALEVGAEVEARLRRLVVTDILSRK